MPKRPCPWDDDLLPQCKIHVGEKEINSGVMEEVNMKSVYEKTMNYLYKGARDECQDTCKGVKVSTQNDSKTYKQMFLKNDGKLQTSGILLSQPLSECSTCKEAITMSASASCDFCDRRLCSGCTFTCNNCSDAFCGNCVLTMFMGEGEVWVCIGCVH